MAEAGVLLLVAATALSAASSIQQGRAADKAAQFNARALEADAKQAKAVAAFEARLARERGAKLLGRQRAAAGASGISLEGSPLLVMGETAANIERDALAIEFGGAARAAALRNQAAGERFAGRQAKRAGFFKAGTTVLGSAASFGAGSLAGGGASKSTGSFTATKRGF